MHSSDVRRAWKPPRYRVDIPGLRTILPSPSLDFSVSTASGLHSDRTTDDEFPHERRIRDGCQSPKPGVGGMDRRAAHNLR
jgi:hypothetical protein